MNVTLVLLLFFQNAIAALHKEHNEKIKSLQETYDRKLAETRSLLEKNNSVDIEKLRSDTEVK